jgi:hypothetical protein
MLSVCVCALTTFKKSDIVMKLGMYVMPFEATPTSYFSINYNNSIADAQIYEVGVTLALLNIRS